MKKYILIIFIFVAVYILFGKELGYSTHSPFYTHFTYQFQHASVIHLVINSLAFYSFCRFFAKVSIGFIIPVYIISVVASFLSEMSTPTVGSSGMIYAMSGMFVSMSIVGNRIRIVDENKFIFFCFVLAASFPLSMFRNINLLCHAYSLCGGLIYGGIKR